MHAALVHLQVFSFDTQSAWEHHATSCRKFPLKHVVPFVTSHGSQVWIIPQEYFNSLLILQQLMPKYARHPRWKVRRVVLSSSLCLESVDGPSELLQGLVQAHMRS